VHPTARAHRATEFVGTAVSSDPAFVTGRAAPSQSETPHVRYSDRNGYTRAIVDATGGVRVRGRRRQARRRTGPPRRGTRRRGRAARGTRPSNEPGNRGVWQPFVATDLGPEPRRTSVRSPTYPEVVSAVDELLQPYVDAAGLEEAAAALDAIAPSDDLSAQVLGDCYDELAEAAASDDEYTLAVRLERRAVQLGCRHPKIAREMLGWYLLKDGSTLDGEAEFAALRTRGPGDVDVLMTLGLARSDAGLQDAALAAFDEAVDVAKRFGLAGELDRARIERRAEREHVGLPLDEEDRLAPWPRPLIDEHIAWTLAWFPPDQHAAALARWPSLGEDLADPAVYNGRLEGHLLELHRETGRRPSIVPLDVDEFADWAARGGYDADAGSSRSRYAAELARSGHAVAWPPGRNDPCWCRSGRKYKRCCGKR
jgi:tetratricopeptide (TPR) repeat protein